VCVSRRPLTLNWVGLKRKREDPRIKKEEGASRKGTERGEKKYSPLIPTFLDEKANYQFVSDSSMKPILPIDQRTA